MNRRSFLQRLGAVAAASGLASALPHAAVEARPDAPPAAPSLLPSDDPIASDAPLLTLGWQQSQRLEQHLRAMGRIGDDAFLSSTDSEVIWRWEQVRQTVIRGYGVYGGRGYLQRIIALPAVADSMFVADEPGHAEWQAARGAMYAHASRAVALL